MRFPVAPQEYGIEREEKEEIGLLTAVPLLTQIIEDLATATKSAQGTGNFYLTKESHMYDIPSSVRKRCPNQVPTAKHWPIS